MNPDLGRRAVQQYLDAAHQDSTEEQWDQWRAQWKAQYSDTQKVEIFNYASSIQQTPVIMELISYISETSPLNTPKASHHVIDFTAKHQGSPRKHGDYFKPFAPGHELSEREQAFCRCEVHVMEKNDIDCVKSNLGTSGCANPFAVCRRTGGYNRECGDNFDFNLFTDSELSGYVRQRIGPIPPGATRQDLLNRIQQWKSGGH